MKKVIRVNYIFWKEGPLLFDFAHIVPTFFRESRLPGLLTLNEQFTM